MTKKELTEQVKTLLGTKKYLVELNKIAKVYAVGGFVRDLLIGKKSKDLDLVITGISAKKLEEFLNKFGTVNLEGESFAVFKFKPFNETEVIDIALPRIDKKTGNGHTNFEVIVNSKITIEADLGRRDFTMNSIAISLTGDFVDPFNGFEDIDKHCIKMTNSIAFADDPLRMLRAIQFAARFKFNIDDDTFNLIQKFAHTIKNITKERILSELEKIRLTGNIFYGFTLLKDSNLYSALFDDLHFTPNPKHKCSCKADFYINLFDGKPLIASVYYKEYLSGDNKTTNEIKILSSIPRNLSQLSIAEKLKMLSDIYIKTPAVFVSNYFPDELKREVSYFYTLPKSVKELAIDGNDLISFGLKPCSTMTLMFNDILLQVYSGKLKNTYSECAIYAKEKLLEFI